jgi:NitT/TauT family transport system permease protein
VSEAARPGAAASAASRYVARSVLRPVARSRLGRNGFDIFLLVLVIGLLWQTLYLYAGEVALTSPLETVRLSAALLGSPEFWPHLEETGLAVVQALVIACVCGLAMGLALGAHRLSGDVAEPILIAIYSIPKITLYPIILLFFGIGMPAKVAFGAIHGVVPVVIFTMTAVRGISPVYLKTARTLRMSQTDIARNILFRAAVPEIFTGLRIGFALTLVGTLMGEMFGSQRGLGFLLMRAMGTHDMATIMSVTLILIAFAMTVSVLLLALDRRLHRHG